jgi:ADP-heptose:LPS heptosyltransferase
MKSVGELPGGCNELKSLLYPFHTQYPFKFLSKFRWWKNSKLSEELPTLNSRRKWITVINRLGARGDTLITANVIRCIKNQYPNIKINCITPYSELIEHDPLIDSINKPETFYSFDSSYFELIVRNEENENVIAHNLNRIGIKEYQYKSNFHLLNQEIEWAKRVLSNYPKPPIAISAKSKEEVKNWPVRHWIETIDRIEDRFTIIQLGDDSEPVFDHVIRFAGKCSMRESAALLSQCKLFVGPDSLLMHIANGLNVKSIIIFGDGRPVNCLGYPGNVNISLSRKSGHSWQRLEETGKITNQMDRIDPQTIVDHVNHFAKNLVL